MNRSIPRCGKTDCILDAEGVIRLNVPAIGTPIMAHTPLSIVFGLALCRKHREEINAADWLTPETRDLFEFQPRALSRMKGREVMPLDYGRAFITLVRFTDRDYRLLQKRKEN